MLPSKPLPAPSLTLVSRPELDGEYRHFEGADQMPFDASAIGLSARNAWWLAETALLTYWPPDQASLIFGAAGLDSTYINDDSTECYVAWNDAAAIVAFRGTQPNQPIDVWTDVDALLVPWIRAGELVHQGFKDALSDTVVSAIDEQLNALPRRTIWLTGHSLGAALATLLSDRRDDVAGLYTFGSPRVGDPAFAHGFDARHAGRSFRYVNNRDVVTQVPTSGLLELDYAHVERELHIDADGRIVDTPGLDALATPPDDVSSLAERLGPTLGLVGPVVDHTPRRYAVLVWNALVGAMAPAGSGPV